MFKWFFNLFKKNKKMHIDTKNIKFALIPGHTKKSYGTETYLDEHEYDWNSDVIDKIIKKLDSPNVYRIERSNLMYTKAMKKMAHDCKKLGIEVAIEFHLNAAGIREARGCEMLVHNKKKNFSKALYIIKTYANSFNIKLRHGGLKKLSDSDRGAGFVREMEAVGIDAYLIEPFFCDYKTIESSQFIESGGKDLYANFWIDQIRKW